MIAYVTYNDAPSGIYRSQVIDVVRHLNKNLDAKVRLIAFISIRGFSKNKGIIKAAMSDAIVLPAFPKMSNWRKNSICLNILNHVFAIETFICRGVFTTNMALDIRRKNQLVCYDGRGAVAAEFKEYDLTPLESVKSTIADIERRAVIESDYRIAVSHALVNHWVENYGYVAGREVVIPCTLSSDNESVNANPHFPFKISEGDSVLAYAGSTADWQSLSLLKPWLEALLTNNSQLKILFLSRENEVTDELVKVYPDRVARLFVAPEEVLPLLRNCDYGLLFREDTVTNRVASPTKFAEYLAAGLKVIVSENIGDYSAFVHKHNCGMVLAGLDEILVLKPLSQEEKINAVALSKQYFSKESQAIDQQYRNLLEVLAR